MKKIKVITLSSIFVILLVVNTISTEQELSINSNLNLNSLPLQAKAYDLEEITVTCNSGGAGYCYKPHWFWGIFKCVANGNPNSYCP